MRQNLEDDTMKKLAAIFACVMVMIVASCAWCDVPIDPEHFEDDVFGPYLFNFDKDGDGVLSDSEIAAITGLNLSGMGISAIEGLQYLTSLKSLDCTNNKLTTLDLSGNTALATVSCDSQVRNLLMITYSSNTSYPYQLDFTNYMTSAQTANVSNVQGLDSSGNNILTIYANGVAMFAARPGSVTYSYNTGHNSQKMSVTLSSAVEITPENFPDEVFGPYLFNFDTDGDGILSPAEIEAVTEISINESGVKSLEGLWHFWNLRKLYCRSNSLTGALLLGDTEYLEEVNCRNNMITSLDLSRCPSLKILNARSNQLAELNITDCDALEELNCGTNADDTAEHTNHITSLDLRGKTKLKELICKRNGLTALDLTDCTALVSVDCCINQIEALDFSHSPNLRHIECWNNKLTAIDVSKNTGLEWFDCGSNDIKTLDVTHNTKLTHLEAYACRLEELDVSKNTELEYLDLGAYYNDRTTRNRISTLDLSNNTKLKTLECDNNDLTAIDVSKLTQLDRLVIGVNALTELDVSNNKALTYLVCRNNKLTELDLSANTLLQTLRCYSNDITTLDLSNNPLISELMTGPAGIMSELPVLRLTYSPGNMPYYTDMKNYIGSDFTNITSLKAYTSAGGEILSSFMADGTASFANMPMKVVYTYDTGYTGSADISADIAVALVPDPDNFFKPLSVISKEIEYVNRIVTSTIVSKETVIVVSKEPSPEKVIVVSKEIEYRDNGRSGGCNGLLGSLILACLTALAGFAVSLRKH